MEALGMEYGYGRGNLNAPSMAAGGAESSLLAVPKAPDKKFKAGGLTATVWKGVSPKGIIYFNVQLGRSYKDKDNNWKNTSSLRENDVPKALVLLQKAYEYIISQQTNAVLD